MESAALQVVPQTGISLPQQSTAGIEPQVFEGKRRGCLLHRPYASVSKHTGARHLLSPEQNKVPEKPYCAASLELTRCCAALIAFPVFLS